tara:strand:- start:6647 stop:7471 length:825 start_codon:yes stop_codon:yes gene_type:complete
MSLGKLLKKLAPIAISAFAGPQIGLGLGKLFGTQTALNPFLTRALTGAATSKLMGGRNKDAVRNALLAGLGGMAIDKFTGAENISPDAQRIADNRLTDPIARREGTGAFSGSSPNVSKPPIENVSQQIQGVAPRTFSGELLQAAGVSDDNLLARLLNTRVGEGLTAGLIAQLLAGDDDEEEAREFEQRPFGFGGPGGQLGGIKFAADGGPMSFPRRNGGIDPSEGSGTKDDVPAMLMAGEFVLTKDAVKGLGDGNQRKGIQRAYEMMDKLEARA